MKSNLSGDFIVLNRNLVEMLKEKGVWGEDLMNQLKYHDGDVHDIDKVPEDTKKLFRNCFRR